MAEFFDSDEKMQRKLRKVTPKMHWLRFHAKDFYEKNSWWALVSEQCVEHIHSAYNGLVGLFLYKIYSFPLSQLARYQNQGKQPKILLKIARHHGMLNVLHDAGFNMETGVDQCWMRDEFGETEANKENTMPI